MSNSSVLKTQKVDYGKKNDEIQKQDLFSNDQHSVTKKNIHDMM